jgi:hypothetical protein
MELIIQWNSWTSVGSSSGFVVEVLRARRGNASWQAGWLQHIANRMVWSGQVCDSFFVCNSGCGVLVVRSAWGERACVLAAGAVSCGSFPPFLHGYCCPSTCACQH